MRATCLATLLAALASLFAGGCRSQKERVTFVGPMKLAGQEVSADLLNEGREDYVQYCYACHGMKGDGRGPAAHYYRPPPRDLTRGLYKFGGVVDGLPHDEDFVRILRRGLHGTPMLAWDIPDGELYPIIQYMKTFSETWQEEEKPGTRIPVDTDTWKGKEREAIARGQVIYHGLATCQQCHPAYITRQEIHEASVEVGPGPVVQFRPDLYQPVPKESEYKADGKKMRILPPDFLFNKVRSGRAVEDLYRIISAGIPGTAMPAWFNSLKVEDVWAMAYYVQSLLDMQGKPAAFALRRRLATQPAFVPPPLPPPKAPAAPAGSDPGSAKPAN